jgi:hypothetical protein
MQLAWKLFMAKQCLDGLRALQASDQMDWHGLDGITIIYSCTEYLRMNFGIVPWPT